MKSAHVTSAKEWRKKMWCTCKIYYYFVTKKDEIMSYAGKWTELEIITLRQISQTKKTNITYFLSYEDYSPKNVSIIKY
jgi:hypothetical protein